MATPFQQQALQRKLIYIACIVVLFTVAWGFRRYVVEPRADDLALREQDVGDVELTGSALRLTLTGGRGLAVAGLWMNAIDKQKKNQWEEFDLLATSVTKLQPHFITPWLFQSWNISYNISVRCDVIRDQYYYIARGLELLEEGEKRNRYQPDMRDAMGTYYQSKICIADRQVTLQSLFQMSSVPPRQRARERFYKLDSQGREYLDLEEFEKFCQANPRLVRRLAEKPRRGERESAVHRLPADVVTFLSDNYKIPSLFEDSPNKQEDVLKPVGKRFPILPPRRPQPFDPDELTSEDALHDDFDAFQAARAWFSYAQEALPESDKELPGTDAPITDPIRQRRPKYTTVIFRTRPARAQSYVAERLQDEHWYDEPWKIKGWFPNDRFKNGEPAAVGDPSLWSGAAWQKAYNKWTDFGERTLLLMSGEEEDGLKAQAQRCAEAMGRKVEDPPPNNPPAHVRNDPKLLEGFKAWTRLRLYNLWVHQTNFKHFRFTAQASLKPETVKGRKALAEAEQSRKSGSIRWREQYETALEMWKKVLDENEAFRRDEAQQEETYEYQHNYLREWLRTPRGREMQREFLWQALLGQSVGSPLPGNNWLAIRQLSALLSNPSDVTPPLVEGMFDQKDAKGVPYVSAQTRFTFLSRKGLITQQAPIPPSTTGGPPGPPGAPPVPPPPPGPPPR